MNKKNTIIITGGDGMVGKQASFDITLNHAQLDILKPQSIDRAIQKYKPTIILHLAAMTDMLACERNPRRAYEVNVIGTHNLALACKEKNIKLVYLSTCAVFDGKKSTAYRATDIPNPISMYGNTKWLGEIAIQSMLKNYLIIRTGWLFGGGKKIDTKFVYRTLQKFQHQQPVEATYDRYGSPTYIPDLLEGIQKLIAHDARGIKHVVNKKTASYFNVAKTIQKIGGFDTPINKVKASTIENPEVARGKQEGLISSISLRDWHVALKDYMKNLNAIK